MSVQPDIKAKRKLVVLGCSDRKLDVDGELPAVSLYDGPMYRVLRSFLREHSWPSDLSIAVLSAKYGLIGALSPIEHYNQRMTADRAKELFTGVNRTLGEWGKLHGSVEFVLGHDYTQTLNRAALANHFGSVNVVPGGIGLKQQQFRQTLYKSHKPVLRKLRELKRTGKPLYFLPDWDDFIDPNYDYLRDAFSSPNRAERDEKHTIQLMRPETMCDGVLVSLAQNLGSKGLLRRVSSSDPNSLAPRSVKTHFGLTPAQFAFGDCGAFSYVNESRPTISIEQAVALYELYEFDLGASVDHIPVAALTSPTGIIEQSDAQRRYRIRLTRENAEAFINEHARRRASFVPIGVIQGIGPRSYATQIGRYLDMGYEHIALGGLVPRTDSNIQSIVVAVRNELKRLNRTPWLHLLGVFRPKLQQFFRESGICSFDSATYFRKAWLRSDQNYLATDGTWHAAIRVPPSSDPRVKKRMMASNVSEATLKKLERSALSCLRAYAEGGVKVDAALSAVLQYDALLTRAEDDDKLAAAYRAVLEARPWDKCRCPACAKLGIEIVIFRGKNRNKSRGAHNTLMLYQMFR